MHGFNVLEIHIPERECFTEASVFIRFEEHLVCKNAVWVEVS